MKKVRILLTFVLLALMLLLTSCGAVRSEWNLFRTEFAGIREFFAWVPAASEQSASGTTAEKDRVSAPLLKTALHKENLPSVYVQEPAYTEIPAAETFGYTTIPRFSSNDLPTVQAALSLHGIEPNLITRRNPAPENHVYAIEFAGMSDADTYYINPACEVTLYVSALKPGLPAAKEDGSNVIYLTYDDGPTYTETVRLLDVLDTYGVKATFFVTGEAVEKYPASARAIVERGQCVRSRELWR